MQTPPPASGAYPFSDSLPCRSSLCLSLLPLPFALPLVTSLLGMSKCKMQNGQRPALARGPGSSPTLIHLGESQAGSAEGQGSGSPSVDRRGRLGRSVQEAEGEAGEPEGRTDARSRGWTGRLYSRQVQCSQCNGVLHEGSLCVASWRSSGRAGGTAGQRPHLVFVLASPAQPGRSRGQGWPPLSTWQPAEDT